MKPSLLLGCVLSMACQVASKPSAGNKSSAPLKDAARLLERSKSTAPTVIQASYTVDERELVPALASDAGAWRAAGATGTGLRPSGGAFSSAVNQTRKLAPNLLVARRAYRLSFSARALGTGEVSVGVRFREPKESNSFRTFREFVKGDAMRPYQLEFTAPAYVGAAELFVETKQAEVELSALSLRMREPLPQTQPVSSWAGSFVPEGYGLVFNDEFNGNELDRRKWFTRYIYSGETLDHLNKENQRYADNGNHRFAGGALNLTATRLKLSQPSGANYESGMIRSDFTLTYGFLEARVKMPKGLGVWPAFWLNSDVSDSGRFSWPPEIDIFEYVNNGKEDKPNQIHISTTDTPGEPTQFTFFHEKFSTRIKEYFAPFNFDEGFHTIGAEWTPRDLTVYVDGTKVVTSTFRWVYADGTQAGPAHILLNLAIGDGWAGRYGIDDSAFPQALAVDWVRVYQKARVD